MLLALAWGLNWPAVKIVLSTVPPFTLRWLGLGGGALILMAVSLMRGRSLWPARRTWPGILIGGVLSVAAFNFFTAFAQLSTSTSRAAVLTYTFPMMAAALAWWLLGERPGRRGLWALGLGAVGIMVLAWPVWLGVGQGAPLRGLVFPLLAALAWALGTIGTKRWPPMEDRLTGTAWQLAVGGVCGLLAALVTGERLPAALSPAVGVALGYHIVVATALAYVLWYGLLASVSATVATLTTLAVPVVGVIGAMLLVGDRPGWLDGIGFVLVLSGAALAALRPFRTAGA